MDNSQYAYDELMKLKAKGNVIVMQKTSYHDTVAYVFIQDFKDGKRTYGYLIPRKNGSSMVYLPQGDVYMKEEAVLVKMVAKLAKQEMQKEFDELQEQEEIKKEEARKEKEEEKLSRENNE